MIFFKDKSSKGFKDGIVSLSNSIANRRNALANNSFLHKRISDNELRSIYKSGIGSKIIRIKAGYSLNNTIQFDGDADESYYNKNLRKEIKRACRFMIGFGRGVIVNYYKNDDLTKPLRKDPHRPLKARAFSGDEITVSDIHKDLNSDYYNRPKVYYIKGNMVHCTRVIDYIYVEPPEYDLSHYNYGGVPEFEMIHNQLISDGLVERASANIVEKNSSLFYKVLGFRNLLQTKQETTLLNYFSVVEDMRSMNGATVMDKDDEVQVHSQSLSNLKDVNDLALRRLSMVTGIPMPILIGENVQGLNSTGDNERQVFQDTIETIQSEYILEPTQALFSMHGLGKFEFKENQGDTPQSRVLYEKEVATTAMMLYNMGHEHGLYLEKHNLIEKKDYKELWREESEMPVELNIESIINEEVS